MVVVKEAEIQILGVGDGGSLMGANLVVRNDFKNNSSVASCAFISILNLLSPFYSHCVLSSLRSNILSGAYYASCVSSSSNCCTLSSALSSSYSCALSTKSSSSCCSNFYLLLYVSDSTG